ncbi:protein of unknown function [endosymbiont DhMRE of Dentiscutata heterogama]|uniref:hypothetical protein n=1 Tax=endosymbiont DhMRE of Dentiscutata heterogama TaxID=1609546 RepID=UPI000629D56D|nr:hypothetical protein [endosymbiont DhMRE of Dentiscutata heterogama]CFW92959.1 protein of unknown function [endosymbiont DhMRE of Dentiscutata heterogama]
MDISCAKLVGGVAVLLTAMGYGYKIHIDRKTLKLEKNDLEHQRKHLINEARIKELEKKNGSEQKQIDQLKEQLEEQTKKLETIIKKCQKKEKK